MVINNEDSSIDDKNVKIIDETLYEDLDCRKNILVTKLYSRRWLILIIFSSVSFLNAFNWIEYNIIQDITISFYNESLPEDKESKNDAVNWFSMV